MLKKFTYALIALTGMVVFSTAGVNFSSIPPQGHTGADGAFCTNCHSDFTLNSGGGSVTVTGLPTGTYTAGAQYNFSLTITHGAANRNRWGFAIAARNANNQPVGTFTETHPNAIVASDELTHNGAVVQGPQASYTYNNLRWTAPASPGAGDNQVRFFYVGNAANGTGNTDGDYIYSGSTLVALPIELENFIADVKGNSVNLKWKTANESNSSHFSIEKSTDNQRFVEIAKVPAAGNSSSPVSYSYTDSKPAYFERSTFYRLVMVDKDGTKKYSNVVSVSVKATSTFVDKIFPNPVKSGGVMQVQMVAAAEQKVTMQLINMSGKIMKQEQFTAAKGTNVFDVQLSRYTLAGMYSLVVMMDGQTQHIPLLVQY